MKQLLRIIARRSVLVRRSIATTSNHLIGRRNGSFITYVFWNGIPMEIEFGRIVRLAEFLKMTSVCKAQCTELILN